MHAVIIGPIPNCLLTGCSGISLKLVRNICLSIAGSVIPRHGAVPQKYLL